MGKNSGAERRYRSLILTKFYQRALENTAAVFKNHFLSAFVSSQCIHL